MKKSILITTLVSAVFFTACGSSNNDSSDKNKTKTAEEILVGKTFYGADKDLKEATGYYKNIFTKTTFSVSEHAEDGTLVDGPDETNVTYKDTNITIYFDINNTKYKGSCKVTESNNSVIMDCGDDDDDKTTFWYKISDIKR